MINQFYSIDFFKFFLVNYYMYSKIKKREQEYVKKNFSIYGKHPINNYLCSNNFTDKACEEYNPGSSKHPCRMYDDTKKKR